MNSNRGFASFMTYASLILVSLLMLFPFFWMATTSLKPESAVFQFPPQWLPHPIAWGNYAGIFTKMPFGTYMFNSGYIAVAVTAGTCLVAAMAGYSFAKLHFPLRNAIFLFLLAGMMIPTEVTAIPLFTWMSKLHLIDTHFPLIFPSMLGTGAIFGAFVVRQFFITVPVELDEAAKLDGCSPLQTFRLIMLPLAGPALATVSIFTFLERWNEFFEPLIYLNSRDLFTLPVGLALLTTEVGVDWPLLLAASTLATIPLLIVFYMAQNKFVEGIANTGLK